MSQLQNNTLLHHGTYRIVRYLASGGFGNTYEAVHVLLGKHVAIKEFFVKDFNNRDEATNRVTVGTQSKVALVKKLKQKFINEAQSIAALQHPNIVKVTDIFEENGTAYYVMDYIDGHSLGDIVKIEGTLSEEQALLYIRQVASALEYVHSKNRLHLDIKPSNIMVDANDNAILIDFGASKQYDEENGENTSTLLGKTLGYAPLEQMGNNVSNFTPATDIYALGATLYKLVAGITPPPANELAVDEGALDFSKCNISVECRTAIINAMKVSRSKRPQNIRDWLIFFEKSNSSTDEVTIIDNVNSKSDFESVFMSLVIDGGMANALPFLEENARRGNPYAQFHLGDAYNKGVGIEKSLSKAVYWWEKASMNDNFKWLKDRLRLSL